MLDRVNPILRLVCLGFAALLLFQLSRLATWKNPLADAVIPMVPSASAVAGTTHVTSTNVGSTKLVSTNAASTNAASTNAASTNAASTNAASTNSASTLRASTNAAATVRSLGTNSAAAKATPPIGPRGMNARMGAGPEVNEADFPAPIRTRVEKVVQSEILGSVMRPPPMALLGIAGKDVFLRAPDGQSGLIREGGELGGVKLLKIGANRVLVEVEGEKKELTIFEGLGGETLLPK